MSVVDQKIHKTRRGFEVQYLLIKYIMHVRSKRDDIGQGMNMLPLNLLMS